MRALPLMKRIALPLVAVGCFTLLQSPSLSAEQPSGDNFVYVMSNKNPANSIIQFQRLGNGSLVWVREVATGGRGTGPNGPDPLGSQDSLVLSGDGAFLLAVNSGSGWATTRLRWPPKRPARSPRISLLARICSARSAARLLTRKKRPAGLQYPGTVSLPGFRTPGAGLCPLLLSATTATSP